MSTNEVKVILSGDPRGLRTALNRSGKNVNTFGRKTISVFNRVGKTIQNVGDRYMTRFSGIIGGAAIALAGKSVIDFDAKLARLAIQANLTGKQMLELKNELFEVGDATKQDPGALLEGVEAIVERTGNFKFATASLKDMAIVASATGAEMASIGATASNLQEKMGIDPSNIMTVFDILAGQGKKGSFTLTNMASLFERLLSAASRFDIKGVSGMRKFGAFLQIARRGTGSSEQAATAVERTIADMISKAGKIRKETGFSIFDEEKSREAGRSVLKDFDVVLKEIIKRTKGDTVTLGEIFGEESIRAVTPLATSFQKFGDFREMDEFINIGGDGTAIMKDFAFWSEQSAAKVDRFQGQLKRFANENLAKPIELFTAALEKLNNHPALTKGALWTLLGLGGVAVGGKVFGGLKGIYSMLKGGKGAGKGGIAGGLGATAGITPVYVVNKHLSMLPGKGGWLPGAAGGAASGAGKAGGLGLLSKLGLVSSAGAGTVAAGAVAAGAAGYGAGSLVNKYLIDDTTFGDKIGSALNHIAAALGNVESQRVINMEVNIDEKGNVITATDMRTRAAVKTTRKKRGEF